MVTFEQVLVEVSLGHGFGRPGVRKEQKVGRLENGKRSREETEIFFFFFFYGLFRYLSCWSSLLVEFFIFP